MTYLLDTNVVSELRKVRAGRANPGVAAWVDSVDASQLYVSAVTILELEIGYLQIARRDEIQAVRLRAWLDQAVLPEFVNRVLPVDLQVATRCAALHVPDPRPERDAMIAATGLVHGMTVVSRNTTDFAPTGVLLLNPWDAA